MIKFLAMLIILRFSNVSRKRYSHISCIRKPVFSTLQKSTELSIDRNAEAPNFGLA